MRTEFPHIIHQYEKGIRTKLLKLANQRGCYELHPWIQAVKNHLWYCCHNCDHRPESLKERWMSIIYHVTNQHCLNMFDFVQQCDHPPLNKEQTRNKKWLKPDGPAHKALKQVVLDAKLLKDIQRLNLCVHTSHNESYHALINKYCPNRQHFSYRGMVARTELAVLDHNNNLGRTSDND